MLSENYFVLGKFNPLISFFAGTVTNAFKLSIFKERNVKPRTIHYNYILCVLMNY